MRLVTVLMIAVLICLDRRELNVEKIAGYE